MPCTLFLPQHSVLRLKATLKLNIALLHTTSSLFFLADSRAEHELAIRAQGIDFFFNSRAHALKFVDFLQSVVPLRFRHDKQLVSHKEHTNTYNYKYTFSTEIVPICKVSERQQPHQAPDQMLETLCSRFLLGWQL